jgi:hypothetical protein
MGKNGYVTGLDLTFYNIIAYNQTFHRAMKTGIEKAGKYYMDRLKTNVSMGCHTLADLRRLDHPYARRHPQIKPVGHKYSWAVHARSGTMARSLWSGMVVDEVPLAAGGVTMYKGYFWGGVRATDADHILFVIDGTRKMHPRPVVGMTFAVNLAKIKRIIILDMGKAHTMAVGRFKETRTSYA